MLINFLVFSSIKKLIKADRILNLQPATCNLTIAYLFYGKIDVALYFLQVTGN
ncbi:hypothetical protein Cyast_0403 [Cyanobacterium stanieri PCC 7202]|uniref:Uncharacterized protein n=1 Tax=Cyanobacterium stanieri (strain ATCC 29140 / PCC 7202) TaxID=292563 RepID=K9YJV0_CYASC|nr:hypothetical protein Cyast_0403 [Cyanobacterium stanieri PCC 7202]